MGGVCGLYPPKVPMFLTLPTLIVKSTIYCVVKDKPGLSFLAFTYIFVLAAFDLIMGVMNLFFTHILFPPSLSSLMNFALILIQHLFYAL